MIGLLTTRIRIATILAVFACLLLSVVAGNGVAHAATTRTWLGGAGANWSTAANWSPAGPPVNGDSLSFPVSATTMATNDDVANLDITSIEFDGTGYSVSGNALTIDTSLTLAQGVQTTISAPIKLGGPLTITVARFSLLSLSGTPQSIDLGAQSLTVTGVGQLDIAGGITGSGGVSVAGAALVLQAATSYTGPTSVDGGFLVLEGGSVTNGTNVFGGGSFGGTGSAGPLTFANALLFPGIDDQPGLITTSSLTMAFGTLARFVLNDFSVLGNDMVVVNGPVALNNATLQLRWAFDTDVGQQFTLISGATSLTGTFAGIPEGGTFMANGRRFAITYKGGAGHDVIITRLQAAPVDLTITDTPSAATFSPGQTVTYTLVVTNKGPGDAPNVSITTDLPAGLGFQSVTAPAGYTCAKPLVGASGQVRCSAPLLASGASVTITVVANVLATAAPTIVAPAAVSSDGSETVSVDNSTTATITVAGGAKPFHVRAAALASS